MERLKGLDYLRGISATAIMLFHYRFWSLGIPPFDNSESWTRIGLYGVSIFYILSGLTLFLVYDRKRSKNEFTIGDFYTKRVFRIFPLLWMVIIATIYLAGGAPGFIKLILNITGLFGIIAPHKYIGTGVWSIGNEIAFYLIFPLIFLPLSRYPLVSIVLSSVLLIVYIGFAIKLESFPTMVQAWRTYINPLNQAFLFVLGIWMGYVFKFKSIKPVALYALGVTCLLGFVLYPVEGDPIALVSGGNRVVFTILCAGLCLFFFKSAFTLPYIDRALTILGEASYSVYLLHPLIWFGYEKYAAGFGLPMDISFRLTVCIIATVIFSYLIYITYERYFMELGKRVSQRYFSPPRVPARVRKQLVHHDD